MTRRFWRASRRWMVALLGALVFTWASPSFADGPSAADKETARGLLDRGDELTQKGDLAGALQAFRGAYAIVHVPTTGAALARTLKALGQLVEAKKVADEVSAMAPREGEPSALTQAREEAAAIAKDVAPRIASLSLTLRGVPPGAKAKVSIDDRELQAAELSFAVPVDPGKRRVTAVAADARASAEVTFAEGEKKWLTLKLAPTGARASAKTKPVSTTGSSKRTLGFVIGGIGVAGLATAGVTGAMLLSRDGEIEDNCPDKKCNAKGRDLIDGSNSLMLVNGIAWGVGVVGVGVGAYFVLSGSGSSETTVGTTLAPGGAGVRMLRRF